MFEIVDKNTFVHYQAIGKIAVAFADCAINNKLGTLPPPTSDEMNGDNMKWFILLIGLMFSLTACNDSEPRSEAEIDVAANTLDLTDYSGVKEARNLVIRDASAWQTLWAEHSDRQLPPVDFSQKMVVAAFGGEGRNGCYTLEIDKIFLEKNLITVQFVKNEPPTALLNCTQAIVYPAHIVTVPIRQFVKFH